MRQAGAYPDYGTRKVHRINSAGRAWPLDYCGHFFVEAYIWTQSHGDLEEYARKDVRQEKHLSALSAFDGFFGAWEFTHGKPPTAPSNPLPRTTEDAYSIHFFRSQR